MPVRHEPATSDAPRRRRRSVDDGLHLARVHRHARLREVVAEEAELPPLELAFGALGVELLAAEDLEHLFNVEQVLLPCRRVHHVIVHVHQREPVQRSRGPMDRPPVDRREVRLAPLEAPAGWRLAAAPEVLAGAALVGQAVLYRSQVDGWVRGTVARRTRAAGY